MLEGHIGYLLSKLGSLSASEMDAHLAPFGVHRMHFGLLKILDAAGPNSQQALSADLGMPPSRMVALVDDLEDQGLVARERSEADRRINVIRITAKGQSLLAQTDKAARKWEDELLVDLAPAERAELLTLLRRIAVRHIVHPVGVEPPAELAATRQPGHGSMKL